MPLHDPTVVTFGQLLLAAVFGFAGWRKATRIEEFVGVVRNFRLLPKGLAEPVARVLPFIELALAAALLLSPIISQAGLSALILLAIFTAAIWINLLRGRTHIDCGCFRSGAGQPLSHWLIGRNLLLMVLAAVLATAPSGPWLPGTFELATAAAACATTVLLYVAASELHRTWPVSAAGAHHHHDHHHGDHKQGA
jgi:hypothetical protein